MTTRRAVVAVVGLAGLAGLAAFTGCLDPAEVTCDDGRICPVGDVCDLAQQRCVPAAAATVCDGMADGGTCTIQGAAGACAHGICEPFACGDGVRNGAEECDGDVGSASCTQFGFEQPGGLACGSDCTFDTRGCAGVCGDGSQGAPEQCDGSDLAGTTCTDLGFYDAAGLACSATCTFDTSQCTGFCGDGVVNGPEVCDGGVFGACSGFDFGGLRCGHDCTIGTDECGFEGWRRLTSPALQIGGLWAAGHDDFYAASTEGLLHFHGTSWELLVGAPAAVVVEGRSPQDFFVAGSDGALYVSDGFVFTPVGTLPGRVDALAEVATDDVWLFGDALTRIHAGTTTSLPLPGVPADATAGRFAHALRVADADQWALGSYVDAATHQSTTVAAHFDGAAWTPIAQPPELGPVGLWASSAHDLWIAGGGGLTAHFDGTAWTVIAIDPDDPPPGPVTDIVGSGITDVLAIGTYAPVTASGPVTFEYRWNGAQWRRLPDVPFAIAGVVGFAGAVMGRSAVDGDAAFFSRGVAEWLPTIDTTLQGSNGTQSLGALQAFAPDDAYALGSTDLLHWDGAAWTPATALGFDSACLWGASTKDLWIGGAGDLVHWDGAAITSFRDAVGGAPNINALFGVATDDVWASDVASPPHLWHFDGTQWTALPPPPGVIRGAQTASQPLAVSGPSDVWALESEQGEIRLTHYDGASWHVLAPNDDPDGDFILNGVFASSPTDAWVVANSHIFHSDGASLVDADPPIPVADLFLAVVGTAPDDVFAVGEHIILHFDGAQWSPVAVQAPDVAFISTASAMSAGLIIDGTCSDTNPCTTTLLRHDLWACRDHETACHDGLDDDCDGLIDAEDPDCP